MATSESFYVLDRLGNQYLSDQWPNLVDSVKSLRPFFESRFIAPNSSDPDAILSGLALGDNSGRLKWRTIADNSDFYVQVNTGTDASPTWVTRLGIGAISGIDFLSLINFNDRDFYLSTAKSSPPEPVVNIKNHLKQDGSEAMTGTLKVVDGSAGSPGIQFAGDPDTGIVRSASNQLGLVVGGSELVTLRTSGFDVDVPVFEADGTVGAPSYSFADDTDTGVYSPSADEVGVAVGGVQRVSFGSSTTFTGVVSASSRVLAPSFYITGTNHSMTGAIEAIPTYGDGAGQKFQSYKLDVHPDHFYITETSGDYPQLNLNPIGAPFGRRSTARRPLPAAGSFTEITHGLGGTPDLVTIKLVCVTNNLDYVAGEEVFLGSNFAIGDIVLNGTVDYSTLNVGFISSTVVRITNIANNTGGGIYIPRKDGASITTPITDASWEMIVTSYRWQ